MLFLERCKKKKSERERGGRREKASEQTRKKYAGDSIKSRWVNLQIY